MLPRSLGRYLLVFAVLVLASMLAFAACGDDEEEGEVVVCTPPETGTPVEGVPELEDGTLNVGADIAYAPMEFFREETADGSDVDMAKCLAEELGVAAEFLNTGWDGIIPALQTEDFDVIMSAMTITEERSEEIDFVAYISVGMGIVVPAGNPDNIQELDDLCGLTVAVQVGTIQEQMLDERNEECDEPVNIVTFDTNPLAVEDLRTGGSDANFSDFPVAAYDAVQSEGELEVVRPQIDPEPYGIGIRKTSTELNDAITDALQAIGDSGKYDEVLAKWDLEELALP